jgi:hypothetical protein
MDESALRTLIATLGASRSSAHWRFEVCTAMVVAGVVLEVVFVIWEFVIEWRDFKRGEVHPPERPLIVLFVLGLFGAGLVAIGVAGELRYESKIETIETGIRKANEDLFLLLSKEAGDAKDSAIKAADAAKIAQKAAAEAKEKVADRTLTDGQAASVAGKINPFARQRVQIMTYFNAREPVRLANRILLALRLAKWQYLPPPEHTFLIGGITGVQVFIHPEADQSTKNAAGALTAALNEQGIAATLKFDTAYAKNQIMINVGAKP